MSVKVSQKSNFIFWHHFWRLFRPVQHLGHENMEKLTERRIFFALRIKLKNSRSASLLIKFYWIIARYVLAIYSMAFKFARSALYLKLQIIVPGSLPFVCAAAEFLLIKFQKSNICSRN